MKIPKLKIKPKSNFSCKTTWKKTGNQRCFTESCKGDIGGNPSNGSLSVCMPKKFWHPTIKFDGQIKL